MTYFRKSVLPSQTGNSGKYLKTDGTSASWSAGGGGLSDGDYGDITVSGSGTTMTIDNLAVTNAKINDVAATKVTEDSTHRFVTDTNKSTWNGKQDALSGTGFVKISGTTISYDNSTYLTSIGTGVSNQLTYWSGTNAIGSLDTATYPSLTELSYVKGVTSAIQTQINGKAATSHTHAQSDITNLTTDLAAKVTANVSITGATKTKVTYDAKGLVTSGTDATTADIADSTNKRYVTDAQLTVIGNTSGTNTGDQTSIVGISGTKAQFNTACSDGDFVYSGDALGTPASGNLSNCTFPTLNQNTSGSAASLSVSGQTGLLTFTGITSTNRAKTLRDAADTILELGGSYTPTGTWTNLTLVTPVLGTPQSGTLTNCTSIPAAQLTGTSLPSGIVTSSLTKTGNTAVNRAVNTGTAAITIDGAGIVAGKIYELTGTTGRTFTFDTGTNISTAAGGSTVGDTYVVYIKCSGTSTGTITLAGATGTTLQSSAVIAIGTMRVCVVRCTGSNTWTVY